MPSPSPRARRRVRRLQEILDAALRLISDEGVEGLTIGALARRLDLTPGALYRYFDSKGALLVALEAQVIEAFAVVFDAAWASLDAGLEGETISEEVRALARLLVGTEVYTQLSVVQPERFRLLSALIGTPQELLGDVGAAARGVASTMALLSRFVEHLEAANRAKAISGGNALSQALLLWSSQHGMLDRRKLNRFLPSPLDIEGLAREVVVVLLRGFGARPDALEEAAAIVAGLNTPEPLVARLIRTA